MDASRDRLRMEELRPPPREVSWLAEVTVRIGGPLALFGWAFTCFGLLFVAIFSSNADFISLVADEDGAQRRPAQVLARQETSFEVNEEPVYEVRFRYRSLDGVDTSARSYTLGDAPSPGTTRTVLLFPEHPTWAVLEGSRRRPFGPVAGLFPLIFVTVGLAVLVPGMRRRARWARLLRHGKVSRARLESMEATPMSINDQPVMALTFRYFDDLGRDHTFVVKTHEVEDLEDESTEAILYDPEHPDVGLPLDSLHGLRVARDGRIVPRSALSALARLLLPILAFGLLALGVALSVS